MPHFKHITCTKCIVVSWHLICELNADVMQFLVTCHFQKFLVFLAVKMAAYEELNTPIYTLFCPFNPLGRHLWVIKLCMSKYKQSVLGIL